MSTNVEYVLSLKDLFSPSLKKAMGQTEQMDGAFKKMSNGAVKGFGMIKGAIAAVGLGFLAKDILDTGMAFEGLQNQMNFASGSLEQGAQDMQYVKDLSKGLGLELQSTAQAFVKFEASARGTSLQGQKTKDIFGAVSEAVGVMHLSADDANGVFLALSQMMSKGKVSAEELRGQLGERVPGAFQIAARAMGVTTQELDKMMSQGKLMSEDFLPKFGAQLHKEFGEASKTSANSLQANMNRISNGLTELKLKFMDSFGGSIAKGMEFVVGLFDKIDIGINIFKNNLGQIQEYFRPWTEFWGYVYDTLLGIFASINWGSWFGDIVEGFRGLMFIIKPLATFLFDFLVVPLKWGLQLLVSFSSAIARMITGIASFLGYKKVNFTLGTGKESDKPKSLSSSMGLGSQMAQNSSLGSKSTSLSSTSKSSDLQSKKPTVYNINIQKLVETLNLHGDKSTLASKAEDLKNEITKILLSAVNDSQQFIVN